jgi:protein-tyrosine phosphatase
VHRHIFVRRCDTSREERPLQAALARELPRLVTDAAADGLLFSKRKCGSNLSTADWPSCASKFQRSPMPPGSAAAPKNANGGRVADTLPQPSRAGFVLASVRHAASLNTTLFCVLPHSIRMQAGARSRGTPAHFGSLKLQRGCISLAIDKKSATHDCIRQLQSNHVPVAAAKYQQDRDLDCFHCTLAHAAELQKLDMTQDSIRAAMRGAAACDDDACLQADFDILGIGSNSGCWFLVLSVPVGDTVRSRCALGMKPFHITLGFATRDNHDITKDCSVMYDWADHASLVRASERMNICKPVASKAARDLASILHRMETSGSHYSDVAAVRMRLIKALVNLGKVLDAQSVLCAAIDHAANFGDADAVLDVAAVRLIMTVGYHLKPQAEATADALETLNTHKSIIEGKRIRADANQSKLIRDVCQFVVGSPQERCLRHFWDIAPNNTLRQVTLPLNFSLQGGFDLAGSGEPSASSILGISAAGFKTVVTLTERQLSSDVKAVASHMKYKHAPINDRHAPASLVELLAIIETVQRAEAPVLVHCLGGKGRTAMLLAAVLMKRQAEASCVPYSASEALALIKDARSVIVSAEQVHMLSQLYGHLTSLDHTRPTFPTPRMMCVGLPCSGKSTFISHLIRSFGAENITIASQDDLGREECERIWARNPRAGSVCVLDRCNTTIAERSQWLHLCNRSPTSCVFFNIDRSVCIRRSAGRPHHPTLPASRAPRIIEELAGQFQAPLQSEGFCRVDEIRSDEDLHELMRLFGACERQEQAVFSDDIVPFPRTPHLINLGAATEDDEVIFKTAQGKDSDAAVDERIKQVCKGCSTIVIEEKVDGANMGFRLMSDGSIAVQNRSHFVTSKSGEQFKRLDVWLEAHSAQLQALLKSPRWILYGCDESFANGPFGTLLSQCRPPFAGSGCTWSTAFITIVFLIISLLLTCALCISSFQICHTDITNMYDRAQKVFLSRECLTQRLGLSAAASGCGEEASIKQVPVVAIHDMVCDAVSVKSLKQVRRH